MEKISERQKEKYKIWAMAVLLTGVCISLYYFHVMLRIGTIIAHLFYVPIILASIWWKRKGLIVAVFSSIFLIFSHIVLRPDVATHNDYFRAFMFVVIAFVVAELSRRLAKEHEALRAANQQLSADEQQLRAANQQLSADEQQLKANNQQLRANEQQLVSEVAERKSAEERVREQREFLRNTIESLSYPFYVIDANDKTITMANSTAWQGKLPEKITCYMLSHKQNKPCDGADHPCPLEDIKKTKQPAIVEHIHYDKDGNPRNVEVHAYPIFDNEQNVTQIIEYCLDITERKKAEEALRESENSYRSVVENAVEGIVVVQGQTLQFVNPALVSMLGYSEKELLTRPFIEFIHPDHRERANEIHIKRLKGEEVPPIYQLKVLDKKGNVKWLENNGILIKWRNRPATLNFLRDITERKRAEEALRNEKEFTETALNAQQDTFFLFEPATGKAIRWNRSFNDITGYADEEISAMPAPGSYYSPEDLKRASEFIEEVLEIGIGAIELELICKDGRKVPTEYNVAVIRDEDGNQKYIISIGRDITERKKSERELKESEERYKALFKCAPDGIIVADVETGQYIHVNPFICKRLGYSEEEIKGLSQFSRIHPKDETDRIKRLFYMQARGEIDTAEDIPFVKKDGTICYFDVNSVCVEIDGIQRVIGLLRDITERKQAEEALRSERDKLQTLMGGLALTGVGIDVVSIDYRVLLQNQTLIERFGDITGELCYEKYMGLKKPCDFCTMTKAIRNKEVESVELTAIDGRSYELLSAPLANPDGTVDKAIEVVKDITEHKQAQKALRESELKFKTIFENAGGAIFIADNKTGEILECNSQAEQMLGRPRAEIIGMHQSELHPKGEEEKYKEKFAAHVQKGHVVDFEGEVQHKDGRRISVWIASQCLKIGGKDVIIGLFVDTTERKKAEEKLLEHEARLKSLASELSLVEERERRQLATELHDRISQSLVISRMKLQALLKSASASELAAPLEEACNGIAQIIQDTRTLTFDLSSPILYELGFEAAVAEWLDEQIQKKHGIKTEFEDDRRPKPLDDDIRVLLFRNVRELLINIVKHANAQNVKVSIYRIDEQVCVSVEDDGVGFDPAEVASKAGFGIFSIRERLEQLGGHLEIESEPGSGSKITMTAPLKYEKNTEGAEI